MKGFSDLFKVPVRLVDTAGIEELVLKRSSLYSKMLMQTVNAIHHSDLTLFVIDGREGVTQVDMKLARWLKQPYRGETLPTTKSVLDSVIDEPAPYRPDIPQANAKNVLLVANKCENDLALPADLEQKLYRLGLGTPIRVASIDGTGLQDLLSQIEAHIPEDRVEEQKRLRMQRRSNYETIRTKERKEILEYTKANGIELDIISWERDFDLVNRNPSDNSDFDEDSGVSMVGSKIV
jgi:predicted GTPase